MNTITRERTINILEKQKGKKIAVIGDVMLDRFFWGNVSRVSPEAPVPVVDVEDETFHLGGAANVANNLKSLGIEPLLCGVLGDDTNGNRFREIANTNGIDTDGLFSDKNRPTTVKTRIIGNNQQLIRLDKEGREMLDADGTNFIIDYISSFSNLSGIIFEDYNKGVISANLIRDILKFARSNKIPVFVDPKFANYFDYKGVTIFKPNRKEASKALQMEITSEKEIIEAGKLLLQRLECENVLLTLGSKGIMLFENNGAITSVPTIARHVADVSGAGDTAIATMSAAVAGGATIREAAELANYAAGAVCEIPGIVPVTLEALLKTVIKNSII